MHGDYKFSKNLINKVFTDMGVKIEKISLLEIESEIPIY
jgi:hypothetical protein